MRLSCLRLVALWALAVVLGGCASTPSSTDEQLAVEPQSTEERLETAQGLWEKSFRQEASKREELQLEAIELLLTEQTRSEAQDYLNQIIEERLIEPELRARKDIAQAQLRIYEGRSEEALVLLPPVERVPRSLGLRVLELRARALAQTGAIKPSLDTRMQLAAHLTDPRLRSENELAIWNTLRSARGEDVYQWSAETTDPVYRGWLALAYIEKSSTRGDLLQKWHEWEQRYPDHPARRRISIRPDTQRLEIEAYPSSTTSSAPLRAEPFPGAQPQPYYGQQPYSDGQWQQGVYGQAQPGHPAWPFAPGEMPRQIAVLLPLSGSYASVAQALMAGIYTAYYQDEGERQGVQIRVYDVGSEGQNARVHYDRAVQEGADFVMGPLVKEAVAELARSGPLSVPALSLNYLDANVAGAPNLFQFGLLPEDEARQAAERAFQDGHRSALAFSPGSEWGRRLSQAFGQRFSELGGVVLSDASYEAEAADYSSAIRAALKLDESQSRHTELQRIAALDIKFEPSPRSDADMIFIAAAPRQARLLNPQFKFHFAGNLPLYATSHIHSGEENALADRDLNGIIYCDIPWLIAPDQDGLALKARLEKLYPDVAKQFPRLAAMGVDAYRIITQLQSLQAQSGQTYEGVTGSLSLGDGGRIYRKLKWARFVDGKPQPFEGLPAESSFESEQAFETQSQ